MRSPGDPWVTIEMPKEETGRHQGYYIFRQQFEIFYSRHRLMTSSTKKAGSSLAYCDLVSAGESRS